MRASHLGEAVEKAPQGLAVKESHRQAQDLGQQSCMQRAGSSHAAPDGGRIAGAVANHRGGPQQAVPQQVLRGGQVQQVGGAVLWPRWSNVIVNGTCVT